MRVNVACYCLRDQTSSMLFAGQLPALVARFGSESVIYPIGSIRLLILI